MSDLTEGIYLSLAPRKEYFSENKNNFRSNWPGVLTWLFFYGVSITNIVRSQSPPQQHTAWPLPHGEMEKKRWNAVNGKYLKTWKSKSATPWGPTLKYVNHVWCSLGLPSPPAATFGFVVSSCNKGPTGIV